MTEGGQETVAPDTAAATAQRAQMTIRTTTKDTGRTSGGIVADGVRVIIPRSDAKAAGHGLGLIPRLMSSCSAVAASSGSTADAWAGTAVAVDTRELPRYDATSRKRLVESG